MPSSFHVVLEEKREKFKAGEVIKGFVSCNFSGPKKANKLYIKLCGNVHCKWTELGGNGLAQTLEETEELIMGEDKLLWQSNEVEKCIQGGEKKFPFSIVLGNTSLPSSFEGHYGSVRYRLVAKIERAWKADLKVEEKLNVESVVDSSSGAISELPATASNFKKPWYQVLNVGQIEARLELPKRYYCGGETLHARINIDNHSGSKIQGLFLHLVRLEHYEAQGREKERKKVLFTVQGEGSIKKHTTGHFRTIPMTIPGTIPTVTRHNSRLLQISFYIELEVVTSAMTSNFKVPLKFTMGTLKRPSSGQFESLQLELNTPTLKKSASLPSQAEMAPIKPKKPLFKGPKLPTLSVGNLPPRNPEYFSPEMKEESMGSLPQYRAIDHSAWIQQQMTELQVGEQDNIYEWEDKEQIASFDTSSLSIPSEYSNFTTFTTSAPPLKVVV